MGKAITICFTNNKGGCGKTTTVCSVGEYWASLGKKILLVDLDSQASLTSIICQTNGEKEWESTIETAFVGGPSFGLPIVNAKPNLDIIPSDLELAHFEQATAGQKMREWMLLDLLKSVKDQYDFILIDCPPQLGLIIYNALVASDYFVLVSNPDGMNYDGMKMIWHMYEEVVGEERLNPNLKFAGLIVSRYEKNKISEMYMEKFRKNFGINLIEPVVRKSTKLVQATSFKQNIFELDPDGKATADYKQVAQELLKRVIIP